MKNAMPKKLLAVSLTVFFLFLVLVPLFSGSSSASDEYLNILDKQKYSRWDGERDEVRLKIVFECSRSYDSNYTWRAEENMAYEDSIFASVSGYDDRYSLTYYGVELTDGIEVSLTLEDPDGNDVASDWRDGMHTYHDFYLLKDADTGAHLVLYDSPYDGETGDPHTFDEPDSGGELDWVEDNFEYYEYYVCYGNYDDWGWSLDSYLYADGESSGWSFDDTWDSASNFVSDIVDAVIDMILSIPETVVNLFADLFDFFTLNIIGYDYETDFSQIDGYEDYGGITGPEHPHYEHDEWDGVAGFVQYAIPPSMGMVVLPIVAVIFVMIAWLIVMALKWVIEYVPVI